MPLCSGVSKSILLTRIPPTSASPLPLLLDAYSSASAAYSLRNLKTETTSVVRVRRSSDNTEANFTSEEVYNGTLASWVGAGNNGFVRTWFDQSGNGRDLEMATTTRQPRIVVSGAVEISNNKPAINYTATNNSLGYSLGLDQRSVFSVHQVSSDTPAYSHIIRPADNKCHGGVTTWLDPSFADVNIRTGHTSINNGSSIDFTSTNRTFTPMLISMVYNTTFNTALSVGSDQGVNDDRPLKGFRHEVVIYPTSQLANLTGIKNNINTYYSLY